MISALKKLFEQISDSNGSPIDEEHNKHLASIALLIETAKADHDFDESELEAIISLAQKDFSIPADEVSELVDLARNKADNATSLYEFTSLINDSFSDDQKYQLIITMWRIAFEDDRIDRYEEHLIRRVADLLYVPHVRFIQAKHTVKNEAS